MPSARDVVRFLKRKGFVEKRQRGSHLILQSPVTKYRTVVPIHGGDLLTMAGAFGAEPSGREFSPLENMIREDLLAILFVRLPQIPSNRQFGRDPVGGVVDYFLRAPKDRSTWQTVPSPPRPFPPPR